MTRFKGINKGKRDEVFKWKGFRNIFCCIALRFIETDRVVLSFVCIGWRTCFGYLRESASTNHNPVSSVIGRILVNLHGSYLLGSDNVIMVLIYGLTYGIRSEIETGQSIQFD